MLNEWHKKFDVVPQVPKDMIRFKQHRESACENFNEELWALYHELYTMECPFCMGDRVVTPTGTCKRKQMRVEDFPAIMCDHRGKGTNAHRKPTDVAGKRYVPNITIERALKTFYAPDLVATCARINADAQARQTIEVILSEPPPPPPAALGSTGGPALHPNRRA